MTRSNFPKAFEERVSADPFLTEKLLEALNQDAPTSIRYNSSKHNPEFKNSKPISWSKNGVLLTERPIFTLDPHFHGGCYYPQESGSQFLDFILRALELPENPIILDLCAAPGGKSTLIADFLNKNGLLVSNEIIPNRAKILKENLIKWGTHNSIVTTNDPKDFSKLPHLFDVIVVDAPCSGEGMFRKDLNARNEWSKEHVKLCSSRQKRIVMDVWNSLKPGGYFIYSTCTFNEDENENNIRWLLENTESKIVDLVVPDAEKGRGNIGYYALPSKLESEGFYFCVIQKTENLTESKFRKQNSKKLSEFKSLEKIDSWINQSESIVILEWNSFLFAVPKIFVPQIIHINEELRVIKLGTEIGELTTKGLLPNVALGLDPSIRNTNFPQCALTEKEALLYLKGETFQLAGQIGYQLMSFNGTGLGFIKHLGNRFNNLYPKEWRIRMKLP